MEKRKIKERLRYWFDNQIARGTASMILLLFLATIIIVTVATIIICIADSQSSWHITLWNNAATAINQWMPEIEEEDISWGFYIVSGLVAIAGLFITSMLIGIISNGIETRLFQLRSGRGRLLEKDHIIILGAENAELFVDEIKAFAGDASCHVLIADSLESDEFDEIAALQKTLPKNIKLHIRDINICDIDKIRLCSIADARAVVINASNDDKAVQSMLAVSAILKECPGARPAVAVGLQSDRRLLPKDTIDPRIVQIQLKRTLTSLLLRISCCRELADAVVDLMNLSNNMLHVEEIPAMCGKSFGTVLSRTNGAVPVGIKRDDENIMVPPFGRIIEQGDKLLFFGSKEKSFAADDLEITELPKSRSELKVRPLTAVYIGCNPMMRNAIGYMPPRIRNIVLVPKKKEETEILSGMAEELTDDARQVCLADIDPFDEPQLLEVIRNADQVSFVRGTDEDSETAETDNVILLHKIMSLCRKEKLKCSINIMLREKAWTALDCSGVNVSIYNLKELKVKVLLKSVLQPEEQVLLEELIKQNGNDLIMKGIEEIGCEIKDYSVGEIRTRCMLRGSILMGYVINEDNNTRIVMNPMLDSHVTLTAEDCLIMLK